MTKHIVNIQSSYAEYKIYFNVFLFSLLIQYGLLYFIGYNVTPDFINLYETQSLKLIKYFEGRGYIPSIDHPFGHIFHLFYILFITIVYFIFGETNRLAIVHIQILLSSISFLFVLKISLRRYYYRNIAIFFTCASLLYYDNVKFVLWLSPESFYRSILIASYYYLLDFYFNNLKNKFLIFAVIFFLILVFTRIDTLILFIPIYLLAFIIISKKYNIVMSLLLIFCGIIIISITIYLSPEVERIASNVGGIMYYYFFIQGIVIVGPESECLKIDKFDNGQMYNAAYLTKRLLKLFFLRIVEYLNIFPHFWSIQQKIYHAVHMLPIYLMTIVGFLRLKEEKDKYFLNFYLLFFASILLHGLARVDSVLRSSYPVLPILILCAGYGYDYAYRRYKGYIHSK